MNKTESTEELKVLAFKLGDRQFGIDIANIREVIRMVEITPVPEAPNFIQGVINLRGLVVPILDLRTILGLDFQPYTLQTPIIISEIGGTVVGLVIDALIDVLTISKDDIELPSQINVFMNLLKGVCKLEENLLLLLELEKILPIEKRALVQQLEF